MKIEGSGEFDKKVINKIGVEGKRLIKKILIECDWKDKTTEAEEARDRYKYFGYNEEDIEIEEMYKFDFDRQSPTSSKYIIVKNQHTEKRIFCGEKYIDFINESFTKKRNEIGVELKEMVEEAKEEIKEENHREDDEE